MKVGVPKETLEYEFRVALVPDVVKRLVGAGFEVSIEAAAGECSSFVDSAYTDAGATVVGTVEAAFNGADIVLSVQPPGPKQAQFIKEGAVLISFVQPVRDRLIIDQLAAKKVTVLSMNRIPRITRAQGMDALSSQSNIAGYKAVLLGASALGKLLPMMITAAGTIRPSKVFVLGAGVAGLQAIATAKRLGAVVSAFDVRTVVKEQVESLGAKFLEVDLVETERETASGYAKELSEESHRREQELVHKTLRDIDIAITTALIPDKPAPLLITEGMVKEMITGSVIVDLAAETGGNCELTEPGEVVVRHGVTIIGELNLPATVAVNSSQMYARNVSALLEEILNENQIDIDLENDVVGPSTMTHDGKVRI